MNNKQRWMGGVVLLGGGILLAALLLKGKEEIHQKNIQAIPAQQLQNKNPPADSEMAQLRSLTVDVETEKRLLEEQRRTREKAVAEQEARAAEFLAMQQQAEAEAARKAAEEYAALNALRNPAQQSSDNIPPELVEEQKAKTSALTEEKRAVELKKIEQQKLEAEKKLAEQKRLAEAEKKALAEKQRQIEAEKKEAEEKKRQALEAQRKLEAARQAEAQRKAEELKAAARKQAEAEKKRKAEEEAKKKAEAEKARDLLENGDKKWMVQVALAANQANADAVVSKLRAKGYKVTTSPTSKGIRIMVGPSKDREAADTARKKISADPSLNMKSAWVIDWVPLDKR